MLAASIEDFLAEFVITKERDARLDNLKTQLRISLGSVLRRYFTLR